MSGLIWIQTVWHSDGIPERSFKKVDFEEKKNSSSQKESSKMLIIPEGYGHVHRDML